MDKVFQQSIFDGTEQSMFNRSIQLIKEFEAVALYRNPIGYAIGYSGGKDSDVLVDLFIKSGVKFMVFHNHTTLDAPETVYYIRKKFKQWESMGIPCKIYYPEQSFWSLCLKKKILPSRIARFCCSELKEKEKPELKYATHSFGVRKAESVKRAVLRDSIETRNKADYSDKKNFHFDNTSEVKETDACYTNKYFIINPIAYWSDEYLWNYIESEKIEINPLYSEGFCRIGCIGCPMAGKHREEEFKRYPKYKERYIKLCNEIMAIRKQEGLTNKYNFRTGEDYFNFWLNNKLPEQEYDLFKI